MLRHSHVATRRKPLIWKALKQRPSGQCFILLSAAKTKGFVKTPTPLTQSVGVFFVARPCNVKNQLPMATDFNF
jgi:hypothetical protein